MLILHLITPRSYKMSIINTNELINDFEFETDICIIGAGAAGISIAHELDNSPHKVLILESGELSFDEDIQSLYNIDEVGKSLGSGLKRIRYFGGTTNIWAGQCIMLNKIDFEKRKWVPDSGWPISQKELLPYYERAINLLNLPDYENFSSNYWKKQLISKSENFLFENNQEIQPDISLWSKKPINMRKAYLKKLKKSSNINICINSTVAEIESNDNISKIERIRVVYSKIKEKNFYVKAKFFVLASGGLENPRILLLSQKNNSLGLGKQFDVVGRYYMEHPKIRLGKIYPHFNLLRSPLLANYYYLPKGKVRFGLRCSDRIQKELKLLNHSVIFRPSFSEKMNQAYHSLRLLRSSKWMQHPQIFKELPTHCYNIGSNLGKITTVLAELVLQKPLSLEYLIVENHLEQKPNSESRVTLSNKRDRLGLNMLKLDWKISSEEMNDLVRFHDILKRYLQKHNLGRLESSLTDNQELEIHLNLETDLTDSSHHMGATRMSNNPRKGVVNQDCQVHGIDNLFVAGSSVFPTGGHANPTLTIVALAIRIADHLREIIKK